MLFIRGLVAIILCSQVSFAGSLAERVVRDYAELVEVSYSLALTKTRELDQRISTFVAAPTANNLSAARLAWREAKDVYSQTEVFRFYGGPIDGDDGPEGLINAWPLDEAYIDYVVGSPQAGIIQDVKNYPVINEELLTELNELGGEKNVATGYHAIEFLLWGQDLSLEGPGQRSLTDFTTSAYAERRRAYLATASALLVKHLESVQQQWTETSTENYRDSFVAAAAEESLTKIFAGVETMLLDELSGERMYVAMESASQEDEQSCFSDHTRNDILFNLQAAANVLRGEVADFHGTGLIELIKSVDPELAQDITEKLKASSEAVAKIPAPFDLALSTDTGRAAITVAIDSLFDLGEAVQAGRGKVLAALN